LWEPDAQGLGRQWAAQGWVLWRWYPQGIDPHGADPQGAESERETTAAGDEGQLELCWIDVSAAAGAGGTFPLAESIVTAAERNVREKQL
jgi:hypothetical protein